MSVQCFAQTAGNWAINELTCLGREKWAADAVDVTWPYLRGCETPLHKRQEVRPCFVLKSVPRVTAALLKERTRKSGRKSKWKLEKGRSLPAGMLNRLGLLGTSRGEGSSIILTQAAQNSWKFPRVQERKPYGAREARVAVPVTVGTVLGPHPGQRQNLVKQDCKIESCLAELQLTQT